MCLLYVWNSVLCSLVACNDNFWYVRNTDFSWLLCNCLFYLGTIDVVYLSWCTISWVPLIEFTDLPKTIGVIIQNKIKSQTVHTFPHNRYTGGQLGSHLEEGVFCYKSPLCPAALLNRSFLSILVAFQMFIATWSWKFTLTAKQWSAVESLQSHLNSEFLTVNCIESGSEICLI